MKTICITQPDLPGLPGKSARRSKKDGEGMWTFLMKSPHPSSSSSASFFFLSRIFRASGRGDKSSFSGGAASLLQISVPIQPGNSGGLLVNENGEVVGIITASAAVELFFAATSALPQNVNWAIKSEYAGLLFDRPAKQPPAKDRDAILENVEKALCFIQVTE